MTLEVSLSQLLERFTQLPAHQVEASCRALDATELYLHYNLRLRGANCLIDLYSGGATADWSTRTIIQDFRNAGASHTDLRVMSALFELSVARHRKVLDALCSVSYDDQKLFDELAERMGAACLCSSIFRKLADCLEHPRLPLTE